jgi:hypothetical protein
MHERTEAIVQTAQVRLADVRPSPREGTGNWHYTGDCADNTVSLQHCRRCFRHKDRRGVPLSGCCATIKIWVDDAGGTLAGTAVASGAGRGGSVVKSGDRTGGACLGSRGICARSAADKPHGEVHLEQRADLGERRGQSGGGITVQNDS